MEDKQYKALRLALVGILKDFERAKKRSKKAIQLSRAIGGTLQKEVAMLSGKLDKLMGSVLKLEQETREI